MDWTAVGAISSMVATIALIVSLFFIWYQLREANKSRQAEAFFRLIDFLQSEEIRQAREHLLNLKKPQFVDWTKDDIAISERVCNSYNRIGLMISEGMIPARIVLPRWHFSIQACWVAAQPMVAEYRATRSGDWWNDFERLYKRARESYPKDMEVIVVTPPTA